VCSLPSRAHHQHQVTGRSHVPPAHLRGSQIDQLCMPDTADRTGCYARQTEPRHRPLRPPPPGPLDRLRHRPPGPGLQARSTRKRGTRHPPRRSLTRRRPHRTVRLPPGMRCAVPGHHHPQYRQEHHPEDHLLDGPPPLMPDQPPDSSNCRDQEQGNDHALIVVAVTGPCKPPLRPWMHPRDVHPPRTTRLPPPGGPRLGNRSR
jgi:hypothetical protein